MSLYEHPWHSVWRNNQKEEEENMNLAKVDNLTFDGIDHKDYPDYVDAYVSGGDYRGVEMSDEQLEEVNEDHDFVYEKLMEHLR